MEWAAEGIALLSAFFTLSCTSPQKVFHFIPDRMDWQSAQNYCVENFVNLASISDDADLARMKGLVESGDEHAFVGLQRMWQWSVLDTQDQKEAEITFEMFEDGEPKLNSHCGLLKPSGKWTTFKCSTSLPFICYDVNIPDRFVKGDVSLSWGESMGYCRARHTDLARIRTEAENSRVVSLGNGTAAWIGLTHKHWSWSDKTEPRPVPWFQDMPTFAAANRCAALFIPAQPPTIKEWDCGDSLPFFCYSFGRQKYTVKITMSASGVGLAGSAADSVLKMVQSKMNDQGFSKDVRLTWSKRPQKVNPTTQKPRCTLHVDP